MRRLKLAALRCIALLGAALVVWAPPTVVIHGPDQVAHAGDDEVDPELGIDEHECICSDGAGACQHKIRNPNSPAEDPCWCPRCREFSEHDGKTTPFGWHTLCYASKKKELFLKRHSSVWGITCSECVQDHSCKFNNGACPDCSSPEGETEPDADTKKVLERLERETSIFKKPKKVTVLYNRRFYMVIDIDKVKVRTQGGSPRVFDNHEYAHQMFERAEHAYRDYCAYFVTPTLPKPIGIFLTEKDSDQLQFSHAYLKSAGANVLSGGSDNGPADGICYNGLCESMQSAGGDRGLTMVMRHLLGHLFVSTWGQANANNRVLPRWVFVGIAHWLARLPERFKDEATVCQNEGGISTLDGKDWHKDLTKMAKDSDLDPIEKLFGKTSQNQLTPEDHKRAWSIFHYCAAEWREPFVKIIGDLRQEREIRDSFMEHFQCTPEVFNERWKDRVLGRRKGISPKFDEDEPEDNDDPTARERRKLLAETDPVNVAALIRGLGTVDQPKTAEVLVDLLARPEELIRASVTVAFLKTKSSEVHEVIWKYGLSHQDPIARAYSARACGRLGIHEAEEALVKQLSDSNWYARAEAALATGLLKNIDGMAGLRDMVNDSSEKARVAAMDALAMFGEDAFLAVPVILPQLKAGAWQLRIASAQALGAIGSMQAVESLIERMEIESGRMEDECHQALKAITHDDLGRKAEHWKDWWNKLKVNHPGGGIPPRPLPVTGVAEGPKKPDPDDRYAKQKYYGIELFSSRIGFVLDTSLSMRVNFRPAPAAAAALSREYAGLDKLTICKEEVAYGLQSLDPRAHFNIVSFNTTIRSFKKNPVPASASNIKAGISFLRSLPPAGETNYYDALRTILDLGDGPDEKSNFRDTPDTLTFLTDGTPTRGQITENDTLLEWYVGLNRFARVKTHVICFGNTGVDFKLLRALAERNGGNYVHVPEAQ